MQRVVCMLYKLGSEKGFRPWCDGSNAKDHHVFLVRRFVSERTSRPDYTKTKNHCARFESASSNGAMVC